MSLPVIVAPSILSANFACLGADLAMLEAAGADWAHVDVMDGHFVPNLTFGPPVIANLHQVTSLPLDVHLMIHQPERSIEQYAQAGAHGITVHQEACLHLHRTLNHIRELGCLAGVSLNPATPVGVLQDLLPEVDLILVMSVNPGFGGQAFIPQSLGRLKKIRVMIDNATASGQISHPIRLEVDGGIGPANVAEVLAAGADTLVAGSAVFGAPDKALAISALRGNPEAIAQCLQQNTGKPLPTGC